ncbi:MAG TPA: DUF4350 domain-containing protein [Acidimicrobiia bacterium]
MSTPATPATVVPSSGLAARFRGLGPIPRAVIVAAVLAVIVGVVLSLVNSATRSADTTGAPSSSLSTASDGLGAYADLLRQYDFEVGDLRGPIKLEQLRRSDTVVLLDAEHQPAQAEIGALRRFVLAGGRLIAGGGETSAWLRELTGGAPKWSPRGTKIAFPVGDPVELQGIKSVQAAGEGSWSVWNDSEAALRNRGIALLNTVSFGSGNIVYLADASPLQNRLLAKADNAALGIDITGGPERSVLFAEGAHGYGNASGLAAVPDRWRIALVGGTLAALLTMLAAGRRLGPPEDESRALPPPRRAYVDAMGVSLARTRQPAAALAPLQDAVRDRLAARAGLDAGATDGDLRAAAVRFGWPAEDIEALSGPLGEERTILAAGRALARTSREGGDR